MDQREEGAKATCFRLFLPSPSLLTPSLFCRAPLPSFNPHAQILLHIARHAFEEAAAEVLAWKTALLQRARAGEEAKLRKATLALLEEAGGAPAPYEAEADAERLAFTMATAALSSPATAEYAATTLGVSQAALQWLCPAAESLGENEQQPQPQPQAQAQPGGEKRRPCGLGEQGSGDDSNGEGAAPAADRVYCAILMGTAARCSGTAQLMLYEAGCWAGCARLLAKHSVDTAMLLLARALQRTLLRGDVAHARLLADDCRRLGGAGPRSSSAAQWEVECTVRAAEATLQLDLPQLESVSRVVRLYGRQLPRQSELEAAVAAALQEVQCQPV